MTRKVELGIHRALITSGALRLHSQAEAGDVRAPVRMLTKEQTRGKTRNTSSNLMPALEVNVERRIEEKKRRVWRSGLDVFVNCGTSLRYPDDLKNDLETPGFATPH